MHYTSMDVMQVVVIQQLRKGCSSKENPREQIDHQSRNLLTFMNELTKMASQTLHPHTLSP